MKRLLALMVLCALLLGLGPAPARAANLYIIPDSDTRLLTEAELWAWQYDALAYILNEIFARHGFPFDPDGRFAPWFNSQSWYRMNPRLTKAECYNRLSNLEWKNEQLVKQVRQQMRDQGTKNPGGKTLPGLDPDLLNIPWPFEEYLFTPNQRLPVYSGPGTHYLRGAKGKAVTSTNGTVYVGGTENGWVLVLYRTNNGAARVGYAEASGIKDTVYGTFPAYVPTPAIITQDCPITDDPVGAGAPLAQLREGHPVMYLFPMSNNSVWAYVEANTDQGLLRGCVPLNSIRLK